ncbi:MAG: sulfotransferase [Anaerolineae bacterium]
MKPLNDYSGKNFCIGFHKTGTTALRTALEQLGYRVCRPVGVVGASVSHSSPLYFL